MSNLEQEIEQQMGEHPVVLYMKGSPDNPQCGFSARAVQLIQSCGVEFFYVNILERLDIREALPKMKNWPTFPQLYVYGELVGGSDIMIELYKEGKLQQLLDANSQQEAQALLQSL
ncbi:MAG: Grx4 family monothiol glutaredoxin [Pseudomonadota bacterium]